ncbi:uncharacterized protein LOC120359529 [Solenopsis invicta]|uniref:uncharacterized protein LOC120359529 n=1 Tax=Solenopsis invicta TaxID=13686 RepID=UPI00193D88B9|nr:uncharacterized protein LOC120359529 [Solenopsis invicta]
MEQTERDLVEQSARLNTSEEFIAWEQQCDEFIELLEERSRVKRLRLTIGERQSAIAHIARLEGLKDSVRRRFMHVGAGYSAGLRWREIDTAFESRILTGAVINTDHIDPRQFLEDAWEIVIERVGDAIREHNNVKVNTVFNGEFTNIRGEHDNKNVTTKNYELYRTSNLHEWYEQRVIEVTLAMLDEFQERDSGWKLLRILNLTVNINKHNPMHAGCDIALPHEIILKRAVINVKSKDNACFAWSVVAALHPVERHTDRTSSYPHYATVLHFNGIEFPVALKDIAKFERMNSVSINVYSVEKNEKDSRILPIRLTDNKKEKHVNLLYMQDPQDNNVGHFTWIKNLSRLVSSQLSKKQHKKYICDR